MILMKTRLTYVIHCNAKSINNQQQKYFKLIMFLPDKPAKVGGHPPLLRRDWSPRARLRAPLHKYNPQCPCHTQQAPTKTAIIKLSGVGPTGLYETKSSTVQYNSHHLQVMQSPARSETSLHMDPPARESSRALLGMSCSRICMGPQLSRGWTFHTV